MPEFATIPDLWTAFAFGVLVGAMALAVFWAWASEPRNTQMDQTRHPISFYPGNRAGVEVWRRSSDEGATK